MSNTTTPSAGLAHYADWLAAMKDWDAGFYAEHPEHDTPLARAREEFTHRISALLWALEEEGLVTKDESSFIYRDILSSMYKYRSENTRDMVRRMRRHASS